MAEPFPTTANCFICGAPLTWLRTEDGPILHLQVRPTRPDYVRHRWPFRPDAAMSNDQWRLSPTIVRALMRP